MDERPVAIDERLPEIGETVRRSVCEQHGEEERRPAARNREQESQGDPDGSEDADPRKADREPVEPAHTVVDDEALNPPVEPDQTGTSCRAWSSSCWGSNGLPMKPWAPRSCASASTSLSTLPENMITGIEPWRSCIR